MEDQYAPASVHTEVVILGAMLIDPVAIGDALTTLRSSDFFLESHRRIFAAITELHHADQGVDLITVRERLAAKKELEAVGGPAYLSSLTDSIPRKLNIRDYVRIVKDKARLRGLMGIFRDGVTRAADQSEEAGQILADIEQQLRITADEHPDYDLQTVGEYFEDDAVEHEDVFAEMAAKGAIKSGFAGYDEALGGGFQPGELIIVAARPSMGKSAWAGNVAYHAAVFSGVPTVLFTLEQSRKAIVRRMLSAVSRVDHKDIRHGKLSSRDRELLLEHRQSLASAPLYIDDQSDMTATRIRAKCMRLREKLPAQLRDKGMLVLVDQLSYVSGKDVYERGMQTREVVGRQTKVFKKLAKTDLQCPVIVLNQLSRDVGKRSDPKPRLEDLKESGNIEEDADVVTFLHRPEYYDRADESLKGKGEFIIAKNREGETSTVECAYQGRIMRWEDDAAPVAHQQSFSNNDFDSSYYDSLLRDGINGF